MTQLEWIAALVPGALWLTMVGADLSDWLWLPAGWMVWAAVSKSWLWFLLGVAVPMLRLGRWTPSTRTRHQLRRDLIGYWSIVGLYLTAGLSFWMALEESTEAYPRLIEFIRQLNRGVVTERDPTETIAAFCQAIPGPESEVVASMIAHGYRHGIDVSDVVSQAKDLEERYTFEGELRRRQDPLWMTIVPAVMLLNVMVVLGVPMAVSLIRTWPGL